MHDSLNFKEDVFLDKEIMDNIIKKVATINDISCLGGASLTQNIPIFSSMGIKSYPVPTVVLSTHSGGYEGYTYHDLTEHMKEQTKHWSELDVKFDCIYSGFLGSAEQIVIVEDFIDKFKKDNTLIVIDPVMGDKGKIYSSIDQDIVIEMRKLVSRADVITPNITEAYLLADMEYNPNPDEEILNELIDKIEDLGPRNIIITSYPYKDQIANIVITDDQVDIVRTKKIEC